MLILKPGTRRQVSHLWAYFVLGQILPISFAQNLFCTTLLMMPSPVIPQKIEPVDLWLQIATATSYLACVYQAPFSVGTGRFFYLVFGTRLLLSAPYFALGPRLSPNVRGAKTSFADALLPYRPFFACIGLGVLTSLWQTPSSFVQIAGVLEKDYAMAALGHDYLIGITSSLVGCVTSLGTF